MTAPRGGVHTVMYSPKAMFSRMVTQTRRGESNERDGMGESRCNLLMRSNPKRVSEFCLSRLNNVAEESKLRVFRLAHDMAGPRLYRDTTHVSNKSCFDSVSVHS